MIHDLGGKWRSDLTREEMIKLLEKDMAGLDEEERACLKAMIADAIRGDGGLVESAVECEYDRPVVGIRQFLNDDYYMGKIGGSMWPQLKEDMIELFEGGYHEAILTGSIGWGKDFFSTTALTYVIYQASCLRDPQQAYGLAPGSPIHFIPISVKVDLARRVVFEGVAQKLNQSEYFKRDFPFEEGRSEINFPKEITIVGGASTNTSALGLNCFGAIIDECVVGSTLIDTPSGPQRADALCDGGVTSIDIKALDHKTGEIVRSDGFIKPASNTEVYTVTLDDGRFLTATSEHPFLVRREDSLAYVELRDLRVGNEVVLRGRQDDPKSDQESHAQEKEDPAEELAAQEGLLFQRVGGYEEGRYVRLPVVVREEGDGASRQESEGEVVRVRSLCSAVSVPQQDTAHDSRLSSRDDGWIDQDCRGQSEAIHGRQEGTGEAEGLPGLLCPSRLDLRSVDGGRDLARIVSIEYSGRHQTFDVMSVPHGNFVANGIIVHNTNFMSRERRTGAAPDKAEVIYAAIMRRMESRFQKTGKLPGLLFLVSSKRTQHDFTERRIREALDDPKVFVRDYAIWDVKPHDQFSAKKFRVLVGDDTEKPRLLSADEKLAKHEEGIQVIDVPEDFRKAFERDIEGALRDIAGIATIAIRPFFQHRDIFAKLIDPNRHHPVKIQDWTTDGPIEIDWDHLVAVDKNGDMVPRTNPDAMRVIHIDPSVRRDATGFCMGHVSHFTDVVRYDVAGVAYKEVAPFIVIDFLLRIVPPRDGEIILADVRNLVYQFSAHGYPISVVSTDQWSAAAQLQLFRQRGYIAEEVSVDRNINPYNELKQTVYEKRLSMYQYDWVIEELKRLEYNSERRKVDHPYPHGTKDVADALCAVVWNLSKRPVHGGLAPVKGLSQSLTDGPTYVPVQKDGRGGHFIYPDEMTPTSDGFEMPFVM